MLFTKDMFDALVKKLNEANTEQEVSAKDLLYGVVQQPSAPKDQKPSSDLFSRLIREIHNTRQLDDKYKGKDPALCATYDKGYWFYSLSLDYIVGMPSHRSPGDFMMVNDWVLLARTMDGVVIADANVTGGVVPL